MPKCSATPMSRPAGWNSLSLPANQAQVVKTGQSPGKPATTHQVPSCGVIQIKHNTTDKVFICSTVDIKKTLQGFYNQLGGGGGCVVNHPKVIDCFNGGNGTSSPIRVCGGFPTAGGNFVGNGGSVHYSLPVYSPIKSPGPIACGGAFNYQAPYSQGGASNGVTTTRPSRPSNKQNWTVEWMIRRDAKTTSMTDLSNWEIGLKNTVQPALNGDKGSNGAYNFCGPKVPGGGGGTFPGGFCGTPVKKGGGFCGTPNIPRRGNGSPGGAGTMGSGCGGGSRSGPSKSAMFEAEHPIRKGNPYADVSGGRSPVPVKTRNILKSVQVCSDADRKVFYPNLPNLPNSNYIPKSNDRSSSRKFPAPGGGNIAVNGSTFQNRGLPVQMKMAASRR